MYQELGGRSEYLRTPISELVEIRLSIIAEWEVQAEQEEEFEQKRAEQEREMEQKRAGRR